MPIITLLASGSIDAPSPLPVDLETAIGATQGYAQEALTSKNAAATAATAAQTARTAADADAAATAADRTAAHADRVAADAAAASTASDRTAVHTDRLAADADAAATAADRTAVHTDRVAADAAAADARATEQRLRQQNLGSFANDAAAEAWAAAQSPAITIITGSSYLNTTADIFRYAVVSAGPTIVWHDVTEDEAAQAVLAQASATAAAASAATANSVQNALNNRILGSFSTDPSWAGAPAGSPPWVNGARYYNTLSGKERVWRSVSGTYGWHDVDEDSQTAATAAAASATTATGSAGTATGAATTASNAAATATTKASDASTYAAAALASYNNANALLSSVSASAIIAQQAAASALVATNLSILAAAARAMKLTTTMVASFGYDTTKDDVSDWPKKCVSQSYLSDTLNTATRGTVAAVPAQMVVMGETTVLSVFMGTDGLGALWKSWTVAGLTCVFARSGSIWYGGTGGLYRLDLITDEVFKRDTSGLWFCTNQKVADYNQGTATWSLVSSAGAIASATVNSVSAYTADMTQPVKARFGLPNATVFVGHQSGSSTIRWDGVVMNGSVVAACEAVAVDKWGTLYQARFTANIVYYAQNWQAASYGSTGQNLLLPTNIGSYQKMIVAGGDMLVFVADKGLATIKLDPTNPANSLYRVKTTTYDTGWMVLGKTVLALSESSADLSNATESAALSDDFNSYADNTALSAVWTPAGAATIALNSGKMRVTKTGAGSIVSRGSVTTSPAKVYRVEYDYNVISSTGNVSLCFALSGTSQGNLLSVAAGASGRYIGYWVETGGATRTFGVGAYVSSDAVIDIDNFAVYQVQAIDRSSSGNYPKAVGSVTRAQVASGTDRACYSFGGSAGNGLESPGSIFDPATGDFTLIDWVNLGSTNNQVWREYANSGLTGTYISVFSWAGNAYFAVFEGGNTYTAIGPAITSTGWRMVTAIKRGTKIEIYVDGAKAASATCSANTLTNATATWRLGSRQDGGYVPDASSKFDLSRIFSVALTPDQIAFMYADEKAGFYANSKELLSGNNVQGVAFDPDTGQLAASNSTGGTDVFAGPGFSVRVANWKSTTAVNMSVNSDMLGAAVGVIPTGHNVRTASAGINTTIVGAGQGYVDVRIAGTATGANQAGFLLNSLAVPTGLANGQIWSTGTQIQLVAGSLANIASLTATMEWFTSGNGAAGGGGSTTFTPTSTPATVKVENVATTATTAKVQNGVYVNFTTGAVIDVTLRISQNQLVQAAALPAYASALSANDNHKAVAFAGGDLVVATGAGVDAFLGVKPGLRETASGVGAPRRAFYDPTWGQYFGVTTDATPTVFASIPIPEGKAYRFRASVVAVMYGGTATEKAVYDITGVVSRDIGGNVVVVSTTTTVSEVTSTMDCVAQANTTAQTLEIKATGKASTRIAWFDGQELYDVGLMAAA